MSRRSPGRAAGSHARSPRSAPSLPSPRGSAKRRHGRSPRPPYASPTMIDDGHAIHYSAVERGTPVYGSDEVEVGKVDEVVDNYRERILDGIVIETPERKLLFVDAPEVARTAERGVTLTIASAEVGLAAAARARRRRPFGRTRARGASGGCSGADGSASSGRSPPPADTRGASYGGSPKDPLAGLAALEQLALSEVSHREGDRGAPGADQVRKGLMREPEGQQRRRPGPSRPHSSASCHSMSSRRSSTPTVLAIAALTASRRDRRSARSVRASSNSRYLPGALGERLARGRRSMPARRPSRDCRENEDGVLLPGAKEVTLSEQLQAAAALGHEDSGDRSDRRAPGTRVVDGRLARIRLPGATLEPHHYDRERRPKAVGRPRPRNGTRQLGVALEQINAILAAPSVADGDGRRHRSPVPAAVR